MEPSTLQQAGNEAVTVGYWLQYAIAPALAAGLPWLKSKLGAFFDDTHQIRLLMEKYDSAIVESKK